MQFRERLERGRERLVFFFSGVMMAGGLMITRGGSALMLVGELKALEDGSYGSYLFISLSVFFLCFFYCSHSTKSGRRLLWGNKI